MSHRLLVLSLVLVIALWGCGGPSEPPAAADTAVEEREAPEQALAPVDPAATAGETAQARRADPAPTPAPSSPAAARGTARPAPGAASEPRQSSPPPVSLASPPETAAAPPPDPTPREPEIVPGAPPPPASATIADRTAPATSVAPSPPVTAVVPEGTVLQIRLAETLSSERNSSGERFRALLDEDLRVDGQLVAHEGTTIVGRLLDVEGSGRVRGRARMSLALIELRVGEQIYPIETNRITVEAEGTEGRDAKTIGGGAGLGAIIGAITGGRKGAAIGAVIGAGAGTGAVLVTKGREVEFEPEQKFAFRLMDPLEVELSP